jgi:hypothetical protein
MNIILGETCLLGYQLRRLGVVDGPTQLFENMLVTAEGVHSFLQNECDYIIDEEYIEYLHYPYYPQNGIAYSKWVNTKYAPSNSNLFSWPIFCFFHYDSFDEGERSSILRKRDRLKESLTNREIVNLYYYYRYCEGINLEQVKNELKVIARTVEELYKSRAKVFLINKIDSSGRGISTYKDGCLVHTTFYSPNSWIRPDDNWNAATDNELFDEYKNTVLKS